MNPTPSQDTGNTPPPDSERGRAPEDVWSFRGYKLRSSEFLTAMVHYFRAEITRANVWRQRLDTTTNWAVIATGASLTIAFSQQDGHHGVIILNTLLVTLFLMIEARRYRYYELWSSRIRLMETDFFAAMLVPPFGPSPDWAESLAENLLQPHFPISMLEALGRRYRRNYIWIFMILILAWVARVLLVPTPVVNYSDFMQRAAIGPLPGELVALFGIGYNLLWLVVGILSLGLHAATGEVLPRYQINMPDGLNLEGLNLDNFLASRKAQQAGGKAEDSARAWFRQSTRRKQLLALIITDDTHQVGQAILRELKRGVTMLPGKGMYTGEPRSVLMVALTVTEVHHLKAIVNQQDPKAFVVVTPAQEVLGAGFAPLQEK